MIAEHLLLDTCVIIFACEGKELRKEAETRLQRAATGGSLRVSPMSAWELGKLVASGKLRLPVDPLDYFESFAGQPGIRACELTAEMLVRSSLLPELTHKDPVDRILIATARICDYTIVTSDRTILAYGAQGHVKTLAC